MLLFLPNNSALFIEFSALEKLKERVKTEGYDVITQPVDITNRDIVYKYAKIIKEDIGPVDILINNAGVVCGQTLLDIPDYMIEKTFNVNILSHYWVSSRNFHQVSLSTGYISECFTTI